MGQQTLLLYLIPKAARSLSSMERGQIFGLELECSERALAVKAWFLLQNLHRWGFENIRALS